MKLHSRPNCHLRPQPCARGAGELQQLLIAFGSAPAVYIYMYVRTYIMIMQSAVDFTSVARASRLLARIYVYVAIASFSSISAVRSGYPGVFFS